MVQRGDDFGNGGVALHAGVDEQDVDGGAAALHGDEDILQRGSRATGDDGDAAWEKWERTFAIRRRPA